MPALPPWPLRLQNQGNDALKTGLRARKKFYLRQAIEQYGKGLEVQCGDPALNSILCSNRAHVQLLLGNFRNAYQDSLAALRHNDQNVKVGRGGQSGAGAGQGQSKGHAAGTARGGTGGTPWLLLLLPRVLLLPAEPPTPPRPLAGVLPRCQGRARPAQVRPLHRAVRGGAAGGAGQP